jgi:hypothetical protein
MAYVLNTGNKRTAKEKVQGIYKHFDMDVLNRLVAVQECDATADK